jgi:hypothetical protein
MATDPCPRCQYDQFACSCIPCPTCRAYGCKDPDHIPQGDYRLCVLCRDNTLTLGPMTYGLALGIWEILLETYRLAGATVLHSPAWASQQFARVVLGPKAWDPDPDPDLSKPLPRVTVLLQPAPGSPQPDPPFGGYWVPYPN